MQVLHLPSVKAVGWRDVDFVFPSTTCGGNCGHPHGASYIALSHEWAWYTSRCLFLVRMMIGTENAECFESQSFCNSPCGNPFPKSTAPYQPSYRSSPDD